MGLYAGFDLSRLGFYETTRNGQYPVNYNTGNQIFLNTFHTEIATHCPVRTGNLLGSIHGSLFGMNGEFYTQCDYAEYVEYGTWGQPAKPYFENALASALDSAYSAWVRAYEYTLELEYQHVFWNVFDHIMAIHPAKNSITFAENWAHNAATASVKSQRSYLYIPPAPPPTIII